MPGASVRPDVRVGQFQQISIRIPEVERPADGPRDLLLDRDLAILDAPLPGLVLRRSDREADMDFTVGAVRREVRRAARPLRVEEEQDPRADAEEDVAIRLLADLLQAHDVAVEPLCAVQVGHVEDGLENSRYARWLVSRAHDCLPRLGYADTR